MSRILRFFALVAVVFFSVNAFAGDPYGSCSARKVYTDCAKGYVVQNGECVLDASESCSAGKYWNGSECAGCPSTHPNSAAGASSESECYKTAELMKNGGSGTCFGKTGTLDGAFTCYYGSTCALPSWNSSFCNMTNGSKIFKGWSLSDDATTGTTGDFVHGNTYYAVWVTPSCNITNGTGEVISALNNKPRCNVTCDSGYGTSGTYNGSAGGTNITVACTLSSDTCSEAEGQYWDGSACVAITYTVQYNANGGSGTMQSSSHTYGVAKALTANGFTRTGYTFAGWATSPSGDVVYTNRQSVINLASTQGATVNLYAKWTLGNYVINLSSSGYMTAGTRTLYTTYDTNVYLDSNRSQAMTTSANPITKPTKKGYTFAGYYSGSGGTGTEYIDANGYITSAGLSAGKECVSSCSWYAKWTGKTYTVSFNANGGTGGQTASVTATYGSPMPTISTTPPTRTGYTFNGWYDAQTGGTQYYTAAGESARTWNKEGNRTLYAQWTANDYSIVLYIGGSFTTLGTTSLYTTYDTNVYLDSNRSQAMTTSANNITKPTKEGHTFGGYYSESGGTGTEYIDANGYITSAGLSAGKGCVSTSGCTWYVKWIPNCYQITLDNTTNGGTGGTTVLYKLYNSTLWYSDSSCSTQVTTLPNKPTKTNAVYRSHYTGASSGTQYIDGSGTLLSKTVTGPITLYALYNCDTNWGGSGTTISGTCTGTRSTVSFDANGGTGGQTAGVKATYGSQMPTISPTAPTRTGYTFTGWYDAQNGGTQYYTAAGASARTWDKATNTTLYAQWTVNASTISFDANGGTGGQTDDVTATYGSQMPEISTTAPTRTGYTFSGWYDAETGGTQYYTAAGASARTWDKTANATLYAQWTAITYTVKYNANGGSGTTTSSSHTYDVAKTLMANGFTRTGYTFAGWATSSSGDVVYTNQQSVINLASTQGATVNLYAKWTGNTYTVSFNVNGGTGGQTDPVTATYGSQMPTISTTKPTRTGYSFDGWTDAPQIGGTRYYYSTGASARTWDKTADTTLYAQWAANGYVIYLQPSPYSTKGTDKLYTKYGTNVYLDVSRSQVMTTSTNNITKPTRDGYTFGGYYSGSGGTGTEYIDANGYITSAGLSAGKECTGCNWYARWIANTYTVSFDANGGTGGQTDPVTATYGSEMPEISTTPPTRTGYAFNGWSDAPTGGTPYYYTDGSSARTWDKTADTTLYANWALSGFVIYLEPGSYSTAGTDRLFTWYGTNVYLDISRSQAMTTSTNNITKPTRDGYTFGGYYSESGGTGTEYIDANGYITSAGLSAGKECAGTGSCYWYARWIGNTYTVSFNANGGTGGQTSNVTATCGSQMPTISTTPPTRTGYTFSGWYDAQTGGTKYYNANGTSAHTWDKTETTTLYAQWTGNTYTVSFNANGGTGGQTASVTATYGSAMPEISTTPPTRTGYYFDGWYDAQTGGTQYYTAAGASAHTWDKTENATLYAQWKAYGYVIYLQPAPWTTTGTTALHTWYDTNVYLDGNRSQAMTTNANPITKPTRDNYTFGGYYSESGGTAGNGTGTQYIDANGYITSAGLSAGKECVGSCSWYVKWIPNCHKITLDNTTNGGTGGTTVLYKPHDSYLWYSDSSCSTQVTTLPNKPTKTNAVYSGHWSTASGERLIIISSGTWGSWSVTGPITLYARYNCDANWRGSGESISGTCTGNQSTVSFNANGGTGGQTASVTATYGSQMPTISTTPPTRTGYTFNGWYDAQTGGNQYYTATGDSARDWDKASNTRLYAQWTVNDYRIVLDPSPYTSGGAGTTAVYTTYGTNVYLDSNRSQAMTPSANNITKPTRTGYTFGGYYSESDGTGTQYINAIGYITWAGLSAGKECASTSGCTWYAKWTANDYEIFLTPGSVDDWGTSYFYTTYDTNVYLDRNRSQVMTTNANPITKPTKNGYTFAGYYSGSGGTGTEYINADGYITSDGLSAGKECVGTPCYWYAKWTANTYTVQYNANGGSGTTASSSHEYDVAKALTANGFTRTGYTFAGWAVGSSSGDVVYTNQQSVINLTSTQGATVDLYAKWTVNTYKCTSGQYLNVTSCVTCTAGYYCPSSSVTYTYNGSVQGRTECGGGKYSSAGATSCSNITAGCYGTSASSSCPAVCAANTYSNAGASSCSSCPTGYKNSGDTAASHAGSASCIITVSGGYYIGTAGDNSSNWDKCAGGTYKASHTVAYGSTSSCTACGAGKYSAAGSTSCSNISAGCYGTSASSSCPAECAAGTYAPAGSASCSACTGRTKYSAAKAGSCSTVSGGYYTTGCNTSGNNCTGQSQCTSGTYCTGGEQKTCPTGYGASAAGSDAAADCYMSVAATKYVKTAKDASATACGTGTYKAAHTVYYGGTSTCNSCPSGYDDGAAASAESGCKISVAGGKYVGTENSATLSTCSAGYYKAAHSVAYGSTSSCSACGAVNKYSSSGASSCSTVSTGYYTTGGTTTTRTGQSQCTSGTYCTGGEQKTCPSGYGASAAGSDAAADCYMSVVATKYVKTAKDASATACGTGTYKAAHTVYYGGTSTCDSCPTGYDDGAAASTESGCKISVAGGKYVGTENSATLSTCAAGYYKAAHSVAYGSTSSCETCGAGYYCPEGASSQTACGGNTKYSSSGASSCSTVSSGYYSTGGTSTTRTGQTKCEAGNYCSGGVKTACGGGKYSSDGATSCSNITAGCYGTSASSSCPAVCAANTYSNAGASACTSCDSDYANSGTDATSHAGVASCKVTCAAGTYVASANAACTDVGSGYYTTASQTISQGSTGSRSACSSLNAFYTASDSGRNATTDCYGTTSSGKYVSTAKSGEVTCAAGGYCAGSVKVYYNSTGGRTGCGAGKYNANTGSSASSACTNITAGCYGTSASSSCPAVCAANTYSDAGASSCSSCPTDYKNSGDTAASHAGSASCIITVSGGYYIGTAGDNSSNWDKCACGTYKASHTVAYGSTSSCVTTDAGYYAAAGASSQTKATAGYYAAAGACSQTACSGRTKYSAAGAASCSTVSTGYYTTGCNSSSNACTSQTICAKGTYCSSGVAYNCPGGTYGSTTGLSTNACSGKCTAGYYCPAGSTSATQNACATNATSAAGSDAISDCVCKAGYSGDASTSSGTCTACACGYYKGSTGNTSCTKTTAGYYATGTGNTGQTKATAGNYAAAGACSQSSCADLGGGLYSSSAAGSDAAADCYATVPVGKYLSSATSTSFTTCTAGYYCAGKTVYYNSTGGRTGCGAGKYSAAGSDASSDCASISAGCYGTSASSACPAKCAAGTYSTGGASACTNCENKPSNSSYTSATGNTSASCPWTCNDGYNQTADNQCGQFCTAGITHIKLGNGLSVPLYSSARTSPAINVKVNNSVCYGSLATGQSSGTLNVKVGSTTYHAIN